MPAKRYIVRLSLAERQQLIQLVKTAKAAAYKRQRAQILLNADVSPEGPGLKDETIAQNLGVCQGTVERLRKRFVEVGFDQVLERVRRQHSRPRCLDGEQEAYLVALSCSEAPQGHNRWSLRLLANKMVELNHVEHVSPETIRQVLKKRYQTLAA